MNVRPVFLTALLALAACATSPENSYYVLTPAENPHPATATLTVTVPAYLDRPQIVFDGGDGSLDIREFDRWAEPVDGMIRRVLTQDMQGGSHRAITVSIDAFTFADDGVTLKAHWTVAPPQGQNTPAAPRGFSETASTSGDTGDNVAAMSTLVAHLAQQIAAAH